jgi:hypothetical protein
MWHFSTKFSQNIFYFFFPKVLQKSLKCMGKGLPNFVRVPSKNRCSALDFFSLFIQILVHVRLFTRKMGSARCTTHPVTSRFAQSYLLKYLLNTPPASKKKGKRGREREEREVMKERKRGNDTERFTLFFRFFVPTFPRCQKCHTKIWA